MECNITEGRSCESNGIIRNKVNARGCRGKQITSEENKEYRGTSILKLYEKYEKYIFKLIRRRNRYAY